MSERGKSAPARYTQYAALPFRLKRRAVEVMLVTSRDRRRWIIPKGWPKSGMAPQDTAAEEAFEEGGVIGKITERPIGSYSYEKTLKRGNTALCDVCVFALEVTRQHKKWPEMKERQVVWYRPARATKFVQERDLRRIIRRFAKRQ